MSDIKLFRLAGSGVRPIAGSSMAIEKSPQTLIKRHLAHRTQSAIAIASNQG